MFDKKRFGGYATAIIFLSACGVGAAHQDYVGRATKPTAGFVKDYAKSERRKIYRGMSEHLEADLFGEPILTRKDQAWKELDLDLLVKKLDRTYSAAGSEQFKLLMQPIADYKKLECRAELFGTLLDDKIFAHLDACVKTFASEYENVLMHLLQDEREKAAEGIDAFIAPQLQSVKAKLMLHLFSTVLMVQSLAVEFRHLRHDLGEAFDDHTGWLKRGWLGLNSITQVGSLGLGAYYTGTSLAGIVAKVPEVDEFILKMGGLFELTQNLNNTLAALPPALSDSIPASLLQEFDDMQKQNEQLHGTLKKIKERKDAQEASRLCAGVSLCQVTSLTKYWHMLDSLDLYDDLRAMRSAFVNILHAMGTLDAYLSVVRLYHEWGARGMPRTFATFSRDPQRNLGHVFFDIANPLLDRSILNNFMLGGAHKEKHAVLTGPHACGKTTSMKSIAYGYILGQSIMIVPAKTAVFVPVTAIKTSFNLGDNLTEGLSSFTAEYGRLNALEVAVHKLGLHDRCLMLVDEPLAKTIQIIGEPRVTDFVRKISACPQVMLLVATHFEEPSRLEKETNGLVKNFQPELIVKADGTFSPTYKIIDGAAAWWFNDKDKRGAFIDWLIKR